MEATIPVDLAKNVFEVALSRHPGNVAERHRLSRARLLRFFAERQPATVLLEAFRNEEIQPVPIKNVEQQTLTAVHRLRSGWLATRTARINAVRGVLRELGHTIPQGARHVVPKV